MYQILQLELFLCIIIRMCNSIHIELLCDLGHNLYNCTTQHLHHPFQALGEVSTPSKDDAPERDPHSEKFQAHKRNPHSNLVAH